MLPSVMNKRLLLLLSAALAGVLPMCEQVEGPLPAGSIKAVDPEAAALMQEAEGFRKAGKLHRARKSLKKLVRFHEAAPEAPMARFMIAQIEEALHDHREAFKQYGRVVEKYQGSPLYEQALNRQLAMGMAAAKGELKGRVLGAWEVPMESSVVVEWLQSVIKNAPYNDMSATAMAVLADYQVRQKRYEEACATYQKLVEDYPDSRYAPAAQMMVAQLWAASHTRGNQNLVNLANAQEAYEEFTLRFPNHPDAAKAHSQAERVRSLLVQQELEVGRYYLERAREYPSAIFCFENVIRQQKVNPEAAREATRLLQQARRHAAAQKTSGGTPARS